MGKRGPKKMSREEAAASPARIHRPLSSFEPETEIEISNHVPCKPDWLSGEAANFWDETLPLLKEMGIHKVDTALFSMLCQDIGTYITCQRVILSEGAIVSHPNGQQYQRPEMKMAADAEKRAVSLSEHFGLSLRARRAMNIKMRPPKTSQSKSEALAEKFGFTSGREKHGFSAKN